MVMVKKSITLTFQQDAWIKEQLGSGDFGNESEVIRALIRARQVEERQSSEKLDTLRAALIEGEKGEFRPVDLDAVWAAARERVTT